MTMPEVHKIDIRAMFGPKPTVPPAHDDTQCSMECGEQNDHIACVGWLYGVYGLLTCDCWCHQLREES